jgi:hypothetical protein
LLLYEDLGVDGRIILKWIVQKYDSVVWTGFIWLSEHGNELSGPIKFWEVLEQLSNWRLLKKDSVPYENS